MKYPQSLHFLIVCLAFSVGIFLSSCDESSTEGTDDFDVSNANINEAGLPKGKPVIEEDIRTSSTYPTQKPIALGKKKMSSSSKIIEPDKAESRPDYLKKKYRELLVFHADDTMEVNKPKLATLILGKNESIEDLTIQVLEKSQANDPEIKSDTTISLGSKMKARLISFGGSTLDKSFEIEPLGDDIQSFSKDRKKILWQWKITPLKPGQQELKLSIQIIEKDGESVSLPAKNIPVIIFARSESFLSKIGTFIETKYEWIITAIMLPILIAWFTTRIRMKPPKPKPEKTSQEEK